MNAVEIGLAAAALAGIAYFALPRAGGGTSASEAHSLVEHGALLLDVRTPGEYADGHLPGATNLPLQELEARVSELGPNSRGVVVYCRSGARSAAATTILRSHGFGAVHDLGAMSNW